MAKPLGGSPIKDSDFKFLTSPSVGRGGLSLSTEEARRFVQMGNNTLEYKRKDHIETNFNQ